MDFGQRGIILTLGEVRSFIRKPYIQSYVAFDALTILDTQKILSCQNLLNFDLI